MTQLHADANSSDAGASPATPAAEIAAEIAAEVAAEVAVEGATEGATEGAAQHAGDVVVRDAASEASPMVAGARRTTITFYLSETLRNRARAAYRVTSFTEQDGSWSDMLGKALLAEVERRERLHNHGERFVGGEEPLTPGRPIGF